MDLGIQGKQAIVCASSKGLGKACAMALAAEGVSVVINSRSADVLNATAEDIRQATGSQVVAVAADITTEAGRQQVLAACPNPDILVNNAGGPPPGNFRDWTRDDWIKALDQNMISAIEMIKATVDGMIARKFGRIVNVTSQSVKSPIPVLGLSNGARSGLTGFVAGIARETVAHNVTINNLLPGPFATDRLLGIADSMGVSREELRERYSKANPSGRIGDPDEFGAACAFLCSVHTGFVTGQNFLMDGGAFSGTL